MFETMFGAEMPLAARFFLAFLVVLGLIGVTAWAVRRFGSGRLGGAGSRGRQPRLGVIDYASVDARRRLILVRRDNVEHLLMIGGPTDVVVEANIVRAAAAAPRDVGATRPVAAPEPLPRAIPMPEPAGNAWPLQPEPAPIRPAPRLEPLPEEAPTPLPAEPPKLQSEPISKRPQRETLAALADEISARPAPTPPPARRPPVAPRPLPQQPAEPQSESRPEIRPEPRVPVPQAESSESTAADQSLAEMAQRLEAALRRPNIAPESRGPAAPARAAPPPVEQTAAPAPEPKLPPPPPPRTAQPAVPPPARSDPKPGQGKSLYDSLEQEMASLLGRPANKN